LRNLQRIEAGQNLTLHTLARIAEALGTEPEELVWSSRKRTSRRRS
jgi:DNA-binding Xre family transcriptional regulator